MIRDMTTHLYYIVVKGKYVDCDWDDSNFYVKLSEDNEDSMGIKQKHEVVKLIKAILIMFDVTIEDIKVYYLTCNRKGYTEQEVDIKTLI